MASSAAYTMLPVASRTEATEGPAFPTGGRRVWIVQVQVAVLAGPFDVVLYASAGAVWREIMRETVSAVGVHTFSTAAADFAVQAFDTDLKAAVEPTAACTAGVVGTGPFFSVDPPSFDVHLLSQRLKEYEGGVKRLIEAAEDDVISRPQLLRAADGDFVGLDMSDPRFLDQMKLAISRQAERRFLLEQLRERSGTDPTALAELAALTAVSAEVDLILEPFIIAIAVATGSGEWARYSGAR